MKFGFFALATGIVLSGCAASQPASGPSRDPARITQAEVEASNEGNAYDMIVKLRPNFLTSRGSTSLRPEESSQPVVFVDRIEHGGVSSLRSIALSTIAEIRLYRSWEASTTFGTGYMNGVIAVTTRR